MRATRLQKILWIVLIISPVILILIESVCTGHNLFIRPPEWSDELDYWRLFYQIHENGFDFKGAPCFYGYDSRFGNLECHGLSPLVAWGPLAVALGKYSNGLIITSVLGLCVAWILFVRLVFPTVRQTFFLLCASLMYQPIRIYIPTSMMEMPCYAWVIGYVALFISCYRDIGNGKKVGIKRCFLFFVSICLAIIRLPYIVLLLPTFILINGYKVKRKKTLYVGVCSLSAVVAYCLRELFAKKYPYGFLADLSLAEGIRGTLTEILKHFFWNLKHYFLFEDMIQSGQRYFSVLLVGLAVFLISRFYNEKDIVKAKEESIFLLSYLVCICGIFALYDVWDYRDYRTLAPITFAFAVQLFIYSCDDRFFSNIMKLMIFIVFVYGLIFDDTEYIPRMETKSVCWPEIIVNEEASILVGDSVDFSLMKVIPSKMEILYDSPKANYENLECEYILTEKTQQKQKNWKYVGEIDSYGYIYIVE